MCEVRGSNPQVYAYFLNLQYTDQYWDIPWYTILYHHIPSYTKYIPLYTGMYQYKLFHRMKITVYHGSSRYMMLQVHCDVAYTIWWALVRFRGSYAMVHLGMGILIQVVGFLRDFSHTEYKAVYTCIFIHLLVYLGICKFPPSPLRKPTTWIKTKYRGVP